MRQTHVSTTVNNHSQSARMHSGTRVDSPRHLFTHRQYISEFSLECFGGRGGVLHVRGTSIMGTNLEFPNYMENSDVVLLYTSLVVHYGADKYFESHQGHPCIVMNFC